MGGESEGSSSPSRGCTSGVSDGGWEGRVRASSSPSRVCTSGVSEAGRRGGGGVLSHRWPTHSPMDIPPPPPPIAVLGGAGLLRATQLAILNANYLAARLGPHYPLLFRCGKGRRREDGGGRIHYLSPPPSPSSAPQGRARPSGARAHHRPAPLQGALRRRSGRGGRREAPHGLRLPLADHVLARSGDPHDRAHRVGEPRRAGPLRRRAHCHPRRDRGRPERARGGGAVASQARAAHRRRRVCGRGWGDERGGACHPRRPPWRPLAALATRGRAARTAAPPPPSPLPGCGSARSGPPWAASTTCTGTGTSSARARPWRATRYSAIVTGRGAASPVESYAA